MKKLDYDYCHAAPVLEWMSQKWALVAFINTQLSRRRGASGAHIIRIRASMC